MAFHCKGSVHSLQLSKNPLCHIYAVTGRFILCIFSISGLYLLAKVWRGSSLPPDKEASTDASWVGRYRVREATPVFGSLFCCLYHADL